MNELAKRLTERAKAMRSGEYYRESLPADAQLMDEAAAALDGVRVPEFTFNELLEYMEAREDVQDGDDGPRPNEEMRLATDLRNLLAAAQGGGRDV